MKITDIKVYIVWEGRRNLFVLKVEADDGAYGWGEAGLSGREPVTYTHLTLPTILRV